MREQEKNWGCFMHHCEKAWGLVVFVLKVIKNLVVASDWCVLLYYFSLCLEVMYQHNNFQTGKLYHFNLNPRNKGAVCLSLCLTNSCFLQKTWQYHSRHFWLRQGVYLQYLRKYIFSGGNATRCASYLR